MVVHVTTWTGEPRPYGGLDALAFVDHVRVRVRRNRHGVRWICDQHGADTQPHCPHLQALAETPADPEKHRPNRRTA